MTAMTTDLDRDHVLRLLEAERARLQSVRSALDSEELDVAEDDSLSELSDSDQHLADIGSETFEREKDVSIRNEVDAELLEVDAALRRLDDGTFGVCERCGETIDPERIEAEPATRWCTQHRVEAGNA
jgi:RNA polymerase-binding transcription factor DksA